MTREVATTMELKQVNRGKVFSYIYQERETSKQAIAQELGMSMPTVTQNVNFLLENGLVEKRGQYKSTGGRKAGILCCNALSRIAIGVELLKEQTRVAAVDLYGNVLAQKDFPVQFQPTEDYLAQFGEWINSFVHALPYDPASVLGVRIAIQGLISPDGETVSYGEIIKCTGMKRADFQKYIEFPCSLVHDIDASAAAELWHHPEISDAVFFSLNRNLGGALIVNGELHQGKHFSSGIVEHICLEPGGLPCYCGRRGCAEAYCSANSLVLRSHMDWDTFFQHVHSGDTICRKIWDDYLHYLARAMDMVRMVVNCEFILGGYLQHFFTDQDIARLQQYVEEQCAFKGMRFSLRRDQYGEMASALGAAMQLLKIFLQSI